MEAKTFIKMLILDLGEENYYQSIKFLISNKEVKLNKKNSFITLELDNNLLPQESKYYYYEKIIFINSEQKESYCFKVSIYINEENNIAFFINKNSNYSFEVIYYDDSDIKNIPESIKLGNKYIINISDNFGLNSCRKFTILNCPKEYLKDIDQNIIINPQFYRGNFLITIHKNNIGKDKIRVFKTRTEYYNKFLSNYTIKDISKNLLNVEQYLGNYCNEYNKAKYKFYFEKDQQSQNFLNNLKKEKFNQNFKNNNKFYTNEIEIMDKYFYSIRKIISNPLLKSKETFTLIHFEFCLNYILYKFFSSYENGEEAPSMIFKFMDLYHNISSNKKLDIEEKMNIMFFYYEIKKNMLISDEEAIKLNKIDLEDEYDKNNNIEFNAKTLKSDYNASNEYDKFRNEIEKTLTEQEKEELEKKKQKSLKNNDKVEKNLIYSEPNILFINECLKNSPYYKALEMLNEIIIKINSKSKLFELLFFVASGTGNNKMEKEIAYKLSLLSERKIKDILLSLIPKFILRESMQTDYNAYYSPNSRLIIINENNCFNFSITQGKEYLIEKEDLKGKYTIPLLLIFMHEIFGHANHAFRERVKLGKEHSPTNLSLKKEKEFIDFFIDYKGESGRALEFYISPFEEIIIYLKFSGDDFPELLDINKWIQSDFNEINRIVMKKIILSNFNTIGINLEGFPTPSENEDDIYDSDEEYNFEHKSIITFKTDYCKRIGFKRTFGCI